MRVRQINHSDLRGGAARAAWRLNEGMRRIGVDSRMVVADRLGNAQLALRVTPAPDLGTEARVIAMLHAAQADRVMRGRTAASNTLFSLDAVGLDLTAVDEVAEADIVHLHWTSYFLSPRTIARLPAPGRHLVWTLHDQWAYTGGCHYTSGCRGYVDACDGCPQLVPSAAPLARAMLAEKRRGYGGRQVTIVAPSRWMASCAHASVLLRNMRIECIPNGVDVEFFMPGDQRAAREALDLPADAVVFLFGVEYGAEKRKGFEVIGSALESLRAQLSSEDLARVRLFFFGEPAAGLDKLGFAARSLGYVSDDWLLRDVDRAADLFVLPSLEDNLPNTMLEAMACGTPVLASDCGGMPDVIRHDENGRLAPRGDVQAFCAALQAALADAGRLQAMGIEARRDIEREHSLVTVARRHVALYEELLGAGPPRGRRDRAMADNCIAPEVPASSELLTDPDFMTAMSARPEPWRRLTADLENAGRLLRTGGVRELARQGARLVRLLLAIRRASFAPLASAEAVLGDGFRAPEGPYPRMNLPRLAWLEKPTAEILVRRGAVAVNVTVGLQVVRAQPVRIDADGNSAQCTLGANFRNRDRSSHRLTVRISPGCDWARVRIQLEGGSESTTSEVLLTEVETTSGL